MSRGITQTNAVCGNGFVCADGVGVGVVQAIKADISQTPCMRLKAAWLLGWRYIYIKKYTSFYIYKFLSFHGCFFFLYRGVSAVVTNRRDVASC